MVEGATVLRVFRATDFAYRADVPLAIDVNMTKVVALEASL